MTRQEVIQETKELWLPTKAAAKLLNVNQRTVRRYIERDEIDNLTVADGWDKFHYIVRVDNFRKPRR